MEIFDLTEGDSLEEMEGEEVWPVLAIRGVDEQLEEPPESSWIGLRSHLLRHP